MAEQRAPIGISPWRRFAAFARALRDASDRWGVALVAAIALYAATSLATLLSPACARFFMERFQLRTPSFLAWALFAPAPWMYNFENRYLISSEPYAARALALVPDREWTYINHQPLRAITFAEGRAFFADKPSPAYVYFESRYRSELVTSAYRVSLAGAPSDAERGIELEAVEIAP